MDSQIPRQVVTCQIDSWMHRKQSEWIDTQKKAGVNKEGEDYAALVLAVAGVSRHNDSQIERKVVKQIDSWQDSDNRKINRNLIYVNVRHVLVVCVYKIIIFTKDRRLFCTCHDFCISLQLFGQQDIYQDTAS